jgi:WD40 repeat protein
VIDDRDDWITMSLISKEIHEGLKDTILPTWPANANISRYNVYSLSFALSEKYFANYDKVIDVFGRSCILPDVCSGMQQHHEIMKRGDSHFLTIGIFGGMIQVWHLENVEEGAVAQFFLPGKAGVNGMKFSQERGLLAVALSESVGAYSDAVFLYETSTWTLVKSLPCPARPLRERDADPFAPLQERDADPFAPLQERDADLFAPLPPPGADHVAFCSFGQLLATCRDSLRIWNLETYDSVQHTIPMSPFGALDVSSDGEYLAFVSGMNSRKVSIWKIGPNGSVEERFTHKHQVRKECAGFARLSQLKWSPDSRILAVGAEEKNCVYLMEPMTGNVTNVLSIYCDGYGMKLVFSPDSKLLFCGSHYQEPITSHAIKAMPLYIPEDDSSEDSWTTNEFDNSDGFNFDLMLLDGDEAQYHGGINAVDPIY